MSLSSAVLWLHVLAGVSWVGACGAFTLAAAALAASDAEVREFAVRSAVHLNRLCLGCACLMPLTGIANLAFAARAHGDSLPREFVFVVTVKLLLFTIMAWVLWLIVRRTGGLRDGCSSADYKLDPLLRGLRRLYGFSTALGVMALLLGLWLAGL